mgnify:CR=1 FL=1
MKVIVLNSAAQVGEEVGKIFCYEVNAKHNAVLGLATGASPIPTYEYMTEQYRSGKVSFKDVRTFNLDEYCDLPKNHPNSFYSFMEENLFSKVDIKPENVNFLDGNVEPVAESARYAQAIKNAGGIFAKPSVKKQIKQQAKEKAPCIVFIDEIDAIGKKRDGQLGGNDEREQTLNQLLTEMDGFEGNNGVIILAATNRPESLDPALTRPGRFDRRVPVELPDLAGREAILKVHAKKIKTADDVDFHTIARMAVGTSGAELANIINEAALRAVRSGRTVVEEADLEESIEVVIAGYQKKNAIMTDAEKKVVAYHEIGHALVAALQTDSAPVQKITIIPRTSGALGYTMQVEQNDKVLMTKEELENKIATLTGGRAAEELVFGQITTGASNDIEQATKLARAMITRYGMTEEFDMVAMETVTNQYLGGDTSLACSADTQKEIDRKVVETVKTQHAQARKLLESNRAKLDELANYLYEKETITGSEFMAILNRKDGAEA